jgi:hypothetical protein
VTAIDVLVAITFAILVWGFGEVFS